MFVRTYTSRLSFHQTALRVPLTHVAMSPLFIFRDLGPISRGIPCLSWRTVPTKGYFPYKSPLNLCNIYQFATDIVTTNITMRSNTCSFDNKRKKMWIAVYSQSATVTYMPVRHYKTQSECATLLWRLPEDSLQLCVIEVLRFSLKQWSTLSYLSLPQLIPKGQVCS